MKEQTDWRYITPVYNLCSFLNIVPPHNFGEKTTPLALRCKLFRICHILLVLVVFIHSYCGRITYVYGYLNGPVAITDQISSIALSTLNILMPLLSNFCNLQSVKEFQNKCLDLSKCEDFKGHTRKSLIKQLIVFHILIAVVFISDGVFWLRKLGWGIYMYYVGRIVMCYIFFIAMFLMIHSAAIISRFFISMNKLLEKMLNNIISHYDFENFDTVDLKIHFIFNEFKSQQTRQRAYQHQDLRKIRICYNKICDLVELFNKIYGFLILNAVVIVIAVVINCSVLFLVYALIRVESIDGNQFGLELILISMALIVFLMVSGMLKFCAIF